MIARNKRRYVNSRMGGAGILADQQPVLAKTIIDPDLPDSSLDAELASFVASATDRALFLTAPDGRIASWNRGAELLTGWRPEQVKGQSVALLYTVQDSGTGKPLSDRAAAAASTSPLRFEAWRIRKDGSEFLADVTIFALRNEDGSIRGFGQSVQDVTSRKATEQGLAEREMHVRSILATVPDAMVVIDERGVIVSFSAAAERLFGFTEAEVAGRNISMLMPNPDHDRHDDYIARYLASGERRIIGIGRVVVGRRRDGSSFPMELSVGEVNADGYRIFTGFIRDLTEQQQSELKLKELQSELIHVSRVSAMGTMASTLAHELNQPLTAIANYMEAARELLERPGEDVREYIEEAIEQSAKEALRAGQIVRRLRDFVARGEMTRRVESLPAMIEDASRLALTGARERGVRAFFHLDPAASEAFVDRVQIQQVLVNLIRNGVDAIGDRKIRDITISTSREPNGMIRLSVADTGAGLDPELAPQLFQAFASTKESGMGLGLSICRTIVEAHGGRIWVEDNPGGGTIFHFTVQSGETDDE
ncbi:PAS domain S-box protein [Sphingomonas pruni]|uniref:PAS domain S-box protein n=1 Tax=Sphingomonas pruni TaxID=40683 RepID=UPI001FE20587|nr:PAS domain S-box protein [Sphingomonas pruni]